MNNSEAEAKARAVVRQHLDAKIRKRGREPWEFVEQDINEAISKWFASCPEYWLELATRS